MFINENVQPPLISSQTTDHFTINIMQLQKSCITKMTRACLSTSINQEINDSLLIKTVRSDGRSFFAWV